MKFLGISIVCLGIVAAMGGYARAQESPSQNPTPPGAAQQKSDSQSAQTAPASQSTPSSGKTPEEIEKEKEIEKEEQSQRALGLYPQFAVTSRGNAPPLSPGEKFRLFVKGSFDPFEFALAGIQAGVDQAENEFPEYGEGAQGYGKRFAADFGDQVSSGFWTDFIWPVVTKEDPRYFRLGHGSFIHRFGYSLGQAVVCHSDKGKVTFNFSNFLGAFSAGALSNTYHPQSDRGVGLTARGASFALAYGSLGQLLNEFWPDVHARLHKHKKNSQPPDAPPETSSPKNP